MRKTIKLDGKDAETPSCLTCASGERSKIYAPCWNCKRPQGCTNCTHGRRRDAVCRCGVYVSRWGLLYNGRQLPDRDFDRYPATWKIAFHAVHGASSKAYLPYVNAHLCDLSNLHVVNTVRRKELGMDAYPEFANAREGFLERYQGRAQVPMTGDDLKEAVKFLHTAIGGKHSLGTAEGS